MISVNKLFLMGNTAKAPETKTFDNGDIKATFSLATSDQWSDKQGNKKEKTVWHNCVTYRRLAEIAVEFIKKGSLVWIEGRQMHDSYEKDGKTQYYSYVEVLKLLVLDKRDNSVVAESHGDDSIPF